MLALRDESGTLRTVHGFTVRDEAGVAHPVQSGRIRDDGGVLRSFYSLGLGGGGGSGEAGVTISPPYFNKTQGSFTFPQTVTTGSVTAVHGGVAPFTYSWARVSGDAEIVPITPAAKSTVFTHTFPSEFSYEATFEVTVTDATGGSAKAQCIISLTAVDYR